MEIIDIFLGLPLLVAIIIISVSFWAITLIAIINLPSAIKKWWKS